LRDYEYPELIITDNGKVIVPTDRGVNLIISLKPNHGFANLTTLPKDKAQVIIDGEVTNLLTPCTTGILISGEHVFTLIEKWYRPLTEEVMIRDGQTGQKLCKGVL